MNHRISILLINGQESHKPEGMSPTRTESLLHDILLIHRDLINQQETLQPVGFGGRGGQQKTPVLHWNGLII